MSDNDEHTGQRYGERDGINLIKSYTREILESIGHNFEPTGENHKSICGLHSEKTASLFLYNSDHHLHCYGCGWHGDLLDYLIEAGLAGNFPESIQFANESLRKLSLEGRRSGDSQAAALRLAGLRNVPTEEPFSPAVIDAYCEFQQADRSGDPILAKYAMELGLKNLGLLNDRLGIITGCLGLHKGQLALLWPYGMQVRPLAGRAESKFFTVGKIDGAWRGHLIKEATETAYIFEGGSDALAAVESGIDDGQNAIVTAIPGCASFRPEWVEDYAGKKVVICLDFDPPGQAAVEVIAPLISAVAKSVLVVHQDWKEGNPKDVRAIYLKHGSDAVVDLLKSAEPWKAPMSGREPEAPGAEKILPEIQLPGDNQILSQFATHIGKLVSDETLYLRADRLVTLNPEGDGLRQVDTQGFRTFMERYASFHQVRQSKEGPIKVARSMTLDTAQAVCASADFLSHLSVIKYFRPNRMPFMMPSGEIVLPNEGYHKDLQMLTLPGPPIEEAMGMLEARNTLLKALEDFPFASDDNRVRALAEGFAVYCKGLLSIHDLQPAWLHQANAPGVGKTTLALLSAAPYLRTPVQSAPKNENDWQKVFTTLLHSGLDVAIFDNIKGHLESEAVEAYLSSPSYMGRELGYSRFMEGPASATLIFSGNGNTASRDLLRRSIIVELRTNLLRPEDREYPENLDAHAIQKGLPTRMAAMWAIVKDWDKAGRPLATNSNNAFPQWFKVFGGIMEHADFGVLTAKDERAEAMVDSETRDIEVLVDFLEVGKLYTFEQMVSLCLREGLFNRQTDGHAGGKLSTEANSSLGKIFAKFDGRMISNKLYRVEGAGRKRRFLVEALE